MLSVWVSQTQERVQCSVPEGVHMRVLQLCVHWSNIHGKCERLSKFEENTIRTVYAGETAVYNGVGLLATI